MRRLLGVLLLVLVACSAEPDSASTTETPGQSASSTVSPATTQAPIGTTSTTRPSGDTTTTVSPATATTLAPLQGLAYEEKARLEAPIQLTPLPGSSISLLATKDGRVWAFDGENVSENPILDISDQVRNQGERGLLSIVMHPTAANRFFAHYSANDGDTVVSEFAFGDMSIDPESERILLRQNQPAGNHNGGMIQFGPDGRLYLGLGDGGGANDQFGHGQNRETLLAGLVAIDIESGESRLFSYGLRNPWRFWIDGDDVYIADVGQNKYEEISVSPLEEGLNYGWSITEGLHCFSPSSGCDTSGLTLPVVEISHGDTGTCSVTGGVVYRGSAIPEIDGIYLFSDYCGGYLRGLHGEEVTDFTDDVGRAGSVLSFGVDGAGEVYVLTTDRLLKIVPVRG